MTVALEVPDQIAAQFHLDEAEHAHLLLEAFLLQRYVEGVLSAGQVGSALGLGFSETERFLHHHGAPPNVTPEEHAQEVATLKQFLAR